MRSPSKIGLTGVNIYFLENEMFESIDSQIQDSRSEISNYAGKALDSLEKIKFHYLRSIVLLIVSEYEITIEKMFILRASKCNDAMLINYVKKQMDKKFRSPDISKIDQMLGMFDDILLRQFKTKITNTPSHMAWDNLLRARHCIVHRQGNLNMTFEELVSSYPATKKVIVELASTFGINLNDL
jgi:hypothetical protein